MIEINWIVCPAKWMPILFSISICFKIPWKKSCNLIKTALWSTNRNAASRCVSSFQVQGLSDELAKQLWMVLQRSMVTVRRDPVMLVSVVRIIEREEKIDRRMVDRKRQTGFIPPGRPKRWKDKMFEVLSREISAFVRINLDLILILILSVW